jgi:hypothetical protein
MTQPPPPPQQPQPPQQPPPPQQPQQPQPQLAEPKKRRWLLVLAIIAAALLLIGLGYAAGSGGAGAPVSEPSTTFEGDVTEAPSQAQVEAVRYDSVEDLRDAVVEAAGYPCPDWLLRDAAKYASESGQCSDEDVFSIFASNADLESQLDLSAGVVENLLVGPTWMINIPAEWVSRVQAGIGGEHIAGEGFPGTEEPSETAAPGVHKPRASDFEVSIKILSKQCFGSAGCLVEYRPKIAADIDSLPKQGTVEVSYSITGGEGPIQGTFLITLGDDPQVEGQDEESTQTPSSSAKLKIKITDVEYTE